MPRRLCSSCRGHGAISVPAATTQGFIVKRCAACDGSGFHPTLKQRGTNPRALGINPRALGTNPKALGVAPTQRGTNPRALGVSPRQLGVSLRQLRRRGLLD